MGRVIKIVGDKTIIQVYEDTAALQRKVIDTGRPLVAELGPGLLGEAFTMVSEGRYRF